MLTPHPPLRGDLPRKGGGGDRTSPLAGEVGSRSDPGGGWVRTERRNASAPHAESPPMIGTRVLVVNLANQRSVEVIVNDRGPAVSDRIADLSLAAARRLGMIGSGVIEALLKVVGASKSGMPR